MVLEDIEDAKEALLDFYGDMEDLIDAIKTGEINDDLEKIAERTIDETDREMMDWLSEDMSNIRYVNKTIAKYGWQNNSLMWMIENAQMEKNEILLEKALDELKRENGIERLDNSKGYIEKINKFRKIYLR